MITVAGYTFAKPKRLRKGRNRPIGDKCRGDASAERGPFWISAQLRQLAYEFLPGNILADSPGCRFCNGQGRRLGFRVGMGQPRCRRNKISPLGGLLKKI